MTTSNSIPPSASSDGKTSLIFKTACIHVSGTSITICSIMGGIIGMLFTVNIVCNMIVLYKWQKKWNKYDVSGELQ